MEQEHRITYKAGITRTPSDFLCQDGELAECINLATDTEELKPIVQPAPFITNAKDQDGVTVIDIPDILYIHKFNNQDRYIFKRHGMSGSQPIVYMAWGTKSGTTLTQKSKLQVDGSDLLYDNGMSITSVGKTLIIKRKDKPMQFFLWEDETGNNPEYQNVGALPDPKIKFWLESARGDIDLGMDPLFEKNKAVFDGYVYSSGAYEGIIADHNMGQEEEISLENGAQEEYDNLTVGLYSKNKKAVAQRKGFCNPFFVRYALELYDGTYTHISNPVLLMPCVKKNSFSVVYEEQILTTFTAYCSLIYSVTANGLDKFSDVVKNISVFVSDGIDPYDTTVSQPFDRIVPDWSSPSQQGAYETYYPVDRNRLITDGIYNGFFGSSYHHNTTIYAAGAFTVKKLWVKFDTLAQKPNDEIVKGLEGTSIFYKLCELGLENVEADNIAEKIGTHTLENLTTQEQLQTDDYFSRNPLIPSFVYSYNSRLNLANVSRGFFKGFNHFISYDVSAQDAHRYFEITVRIKGDTRNFYVKTDRFVTSEQMGVYFFYPDSRANHVWIMKYNSVSSTSGTLILSADLKEHPALNGAYYLAGLPGINASEPGSSSGSQPPSTIDNDSVEMLPNYIIQSEVNNPWVFKAEGYNKVGTGKIIGMSTTTQALSQGQFGQFPLLVFSESGIWAMAVDRTGLYANISPMSRDVCINPGSILQTDGAVFFVSKKGLMVVTGNQVVCVSERMNGATFNTATLSPLATDTDWEDIVGDCQDSSTFLDYIRDESVFMAYDYIDSRIIIVNLHFKYSFVYNIADGTISKVILPASMTNAVNNYPDYLIQGTKSNDQVWVYSFYEKPREEEVNVRSLAFLLTRPMKIAGPVSQASLRQLKNVGTWKRKDMQGNELSCVKTEVYVSEDLDKWYPDISRFGAAARYFRLALYIKMLPTERLSGTILTEQERRSNHMR